MIRHETETAPVLSTISARAIVYVKKKEKKINWNGRSIPRSKGELGKLITIS